MARWCATGEPVMVLVWFESILDTTPIHSDKRLNGEAAVIVLSNISAVAVAGAVSFYFRA